MSISNKVYFLVGFDGLLDAYVKKGNVDIHCSRIKEESKIVLSDEGRLNLKLSESCQDDVILEILSKYLIVGKNINFDLERTSDKYILMPVKLEKDKGYSKLTVDCKQSAVSLECANWTDMFKVALDR